MFYPKRMRSADYLSFYAEHFHTVEVDSTFYGCPSARTVNNWGARTSEQFIFSVKVPQVITHEKVLAECDAELKEFLDNDEYPRAEAWSDSVSVSVLQSEHLSGPT